MSGRPRASVCPACRRDAISPRESPGAGVGTFNIGSIVREREPQPESGIVDSPMRRAAQRQSRLAGPYSPWCKFRVDREWRCARLARRNKEHAGQYSRSYRVKRVQRRSNAGGVHHGLLRDAA
jgi:hypothetical protein